MHAIVFVIVFGFLVNSGAVSLVGFTLDFDLSVIFGFIERLCCFGVFLFVFLFFNVQNDLSLLFVDDFFFFVLECRVSFFDLAINLDDSFNIVLIFDFLL